MKLIYKKLPFNKIKNCIVTIGVFDGVHLGHQYVLKKVKSEATRKKKKSLAISFDLPPEKILHPNHKFEGYITDYQQKISLVRSLGLDYTWLLKTEPKLLQFSSEQFLSYINKYVSIDKIIVGSDFRFGIKAEAGIEELEKSADDYGFKVEVVKKKKFYGRIVSSSFLRKKIKSSAVREVKKFLGREYTIKGEVKRGKGIGKQLGFPTANLDTFDYVLPSSGVYAAYGKVSGKNFLAAVNISEDDFEVHLIKFSKNILAKIVEVSFLEKIRDEFVFDSRVKLIKQIQKDIQIITSKYSTPPD